MESLAQSSVEQTCDEDELGWLPVGVSRSNPTPEIILTKDDMAVWTWLVSKGIASALSGLSEMVGHEITVTSLDIKRLQAKDAAGLLGGPEAPGIGIYLAIHGDATGHLLLMHDPKIAFELIDLQMGLPPGSTQKLGEMESSVLGEMGNVTASFFLNTLADSTSLVLMPSPPAVIVDMVGAIMNIPLTFIMEKQDDVLVVKTTFSAGSRQINGTFMVLPTMDFINAILKHSRTQCVRSPQN